MKKINADTILTDKQYGVVLLEGEPTVKGQIEARKKCLAECEKEAKKKNSDIYPSMVAAWTASHKKTIAILEGLIKKETAFDKVVHDVDCTRGAPMGRRSDDERLKPTNKAVFDRSVPLTQGYDKGGAYWGNPSNLRVEYTKDLTYIRFYRTY